MRLPVSKISVLEQLYKEIPIGVELKNYAFILANDVYESEKHLIADGMYKGFKIMSFIFLEQGSAYLTSNIYDLDRYVRVN